jgi:hypothetical protein
MRKRNRGVVVDVDDQALAHVENGLGCKIFAAGPAYASTAALGTSSRRESGHRNRHDNGAAVSGRDKVSSLHGEWPLPTTRWAAGSKSRPPRHDRHAPAHAETSSRGHLDALGASPAAPWHHRPSRPTRTHRVDWQLALASHAGTLSGDAPTRRDDHDCI